MKKYSIAVMPTAFQQIDEFISHLINEGNPLNAEKWKTEIIQTISSLTSMPESHSFARENDLLPEVQVRHLVFKAHRIIFTIDEKESKVYIHQVRHAAMRRAGLKELQPK